MPEWAATIIASLITGVLGFLGGFLTKTYQDKSTTKLKQIQKNSFGSKAVQIGIQSNNNRGEKDERNKTGS